MPAVAADQHKDAPEAIAHPCACDLVHASFEWRIKNTGLELLIPTRATLLANLAGPLDADTVAINQMADELFTERPVIRSRSNTQGSLARPATRSS